jgi:curli biogenesis system outer membrane secretion channel CsgG
MRFTQTVLMTVALLVSSLVAHHATAARASIGILPFENKARIETSVSEALVDMLMTSITKTNKFDVVERSTLASVIEEQNLGASGLVESSSAARFGKLTGADYLVIGSVTEAGATSGGVGLGAIKVGATKVSLALDIRFVDSSSGKVMFADTFRNDKRGLGLKLSTIEFDPYGKQGGEMARAVISELTRRIMTSVYPPRIVSYNEAANEVSLNYGEVLFAAGEVWGVYAQGADIMDPDTGEFLGTEETEIGRIEIQASQGKLSKAAVLHGAMTKGAVCRLIPAGSGKSGGSKGGGVKRFRNRFKRK